MNLPTEVNPTKACQAGQVLEGVIPAADLTRVEGVKDLKYRFEFDLNDKGEPEISLALKANCTFQCQRCNQMMNYQLDERVSLEELESFNPKVVVEDELILVLPMIPMHQEKDCTFSQNKAYYAAKLEKNTYQPFADLGKALKGKE